MNENLFEAQYDVSKKSRLKKFYEANKILIFSVIFFIIIIFSSTVFYLETKKNKKIQLAENYIQARISLENSDKNKATNYLKDIVYAKDSTYSVLSLFLILNENLIVDEDELSNLFEHVLKNNKFDKEIRNLIIFKKAVFLSNYISEQELLDVTKPLINTNTIWKPHALLLLGDYFVSKKEYLKAKEFYVQILSQKNLHQELYDQARSQLRLIVNE